MASAFILYTAYYLSVDVKFHQILKWISIWNFHWVCLCMSTDISTEIIFLKYRWYLLAYSSYTVPMCIVFSNFGALLQNPSSNSLSREANILWDANGWRVVLLEYMYFFYRFGSPLVVNLFIYLKFFLKMCAQQNEA